MIDIYDMEQNTTKEGRFDLQTFTSRILRIFKGKLAKVVSISDQKQAGLGDWW